MQNLIPCLWFDDQAEEATYFYTSIFKDSKVGEITRYGEAGPRPAGMVLTTTFQINGQDFVAVNGGPEFHFTPAVSFQVFCETQDEVDNLWEKLSEGGEKGQCGWLTDKYGLSWQVVPRVLPAMLSDANTERAQRVMQVMLQMTKLDIATLEKAYAQV